MRRINLMNGYQFIVVQSMWIIVNKSCDTIFQIFSNSIEQAKLLTIVI